ncbi:MAG: hypothetical protein AVDCRST_MAG24-1494, partial [uncultured Nocardioidaceae bacterium]
GSRGPARRCGWCRSRPTPRSSASGARTRCCGPLRRRQPSCAAGGSWRGSSRCSWWPDGPRTRPGWMPVPGDGTSTAGSPPARRRCPGLSARRLRAVAARWCSSTTWSRPGRRCGRHSAPWRRSESRRSEPPRWRRRGAGRSRAARRPRHAVRNRSGPLPWV